MFKRILLVGALLLMIFGCTACKNGEKISFEIAKDIGFLTEGLETHPTITELIKSVGDLEQLCDQSGLTLKTQQYNDLFFNDKALIIIAFIEESSSIDNQIDNVKLQDEKLIVNVTRLIPKGTLLGVTKNEFFVIEVNQTDVTQINNIEILRKNKNK